MGRYITNTDVTLSLRVPGQSQSWEDGIFDELLTTVVDEAEKRIDEMTQGWSPFDTASSTDDMEVYATNAAIYGILETPPFSVMPTAIEANGSELSLPYKAYHAIEQELSGKSLEVQPSVNSESGSFLRGYSKNEFIPGVKYNLIGGTWWWSAIPSGVKLASIRVSARSFLALRNAMGVVEIAGGTMYEPRYDPQVKAWLGKFMGDEIV